MKYTYRELFTKHLPEPYLSQALINTTVRGLDIDRPFQDGTGLRDALLSAFVWEETPEGFAYWLAASEGELKPEARTPIPEPGDRLADLESRIAVLEGLVSSPCVADAGPELVDPGEGYRLVEVGEYIETGDEWLEEDGRWAASYWKTGSCVPKAIETPLRRKIAAPPAPPTYRLLNPDEFIREGDEYCWTCGEWVPTVETGRDGTRVTGEFFGRYRRQITSYEDA